METTRANRTYSDNTVRAWARGFLGAVSGRPKVCQWLFRVAVGKYAWSEYTGLWNSVQAAGINPDGERDLRSMIEDFQVRWFAAFAEAMTAEEDTEIMREKD